MKADYSIGNQDPSLTLESISLDMCVWLCEQHMLDEDLPCMLVSYYINTRTCRFYDIYNINTDFVYSVNYFIYQWYYLGEHYYSNTVLFKIFLKLILIMATN